VRDEQAQLLTLSHRILAGYGKASGTALEAEIIRLYASAGPTARLGFFTSLAEGFGPNWEEARRAWAAHEAEPSRKHFRGLISALEPARQELFRRINSAPGATAALVQLRADLLRAQAQYPALNVVDDDLSHLLQSWFNHGSLVMRRIDWSTSADLLERIIRYEAVHRIGDWDELRRRLLPSDRRCYAFFHPAMANDPLIFVEVALVDRIPDSIQALLAKDRIPMAQAFASTAVFYAISNCQPGLQGLSFGSFLIKQVVEELSRELPRLSTFVTLSPVPGFRRWLETKALDVKTRAILMKRDWHSGASTAARLKPILLPMAAEYLLRERDDRGRVIDPVARFHLGNGARLERLCWLGDSSPKGLNESAGLMVNYLYDFPSLEANREAFAKGARVTVGEPVRRILRTPCPSKCTRH